VSEPSHARDDLMRDELILRAVALVDAARAAGEDGADPIDAVLALLAPDEDDSMNDAIVDGARIAMMLASLVARWVPREITDHLRDTTIGDAS
jgi:hypothetical protein